MGEETIGEGEWRGLRVKEGEGWKGRWIGLNMEKDGVAG